MSKIFCIGFPKTGTTSLEEALIILGYSVCKGHYDNNYSNYLISLFLNHDFKEIDRIIKYYDAFADLPWGGTDFYKYLYKKYPDALFIHTQREAESWYNSLIGMLLKNNSDPKHMLRDFHANSRYGLVYYLRSIVQQEEIYDSKDKLIAYYRALNKEIGDFFVDKNNYFSINIIEHGSWDLLCSFLQKETPKIPFPHANPAKNYLKKMRNTNSFQPKLYNFFKFFFKR